MTWNTLGSMTTHRHGLGVVVLEGPLYAVGGHDGRTFFPFSLMRTNLQSNQILKMENLINFQ